MGAFFYMFTTVQRDVDNSTGCYNLKCPGFVQASGAALLPGQAAAPPSVYGEEHQYVTIILNSVSFNHSIKTI